MATEINTPSTSFQFDEETLHFPGKINSIQGLEAHLNITARLSHALWLALSNPDAFGEERNRQALAELACEVSDHASTAVHCFNHNIQT